MRAFDLLPQLFFMKLLPTFLITLLLGRARIIKHNKQHKSKKEAYYLFFKKA